MRFIAALILIAVAAPAENLRLSNRFLDVSIETATGAFHVSGKRTGTAWDQKSTRAGIVWKSISLSGGKVILTSDAYRAELTLENSRPEFEVTLTGEGALKDLVGFPLPQTLCRKLRQNLPYFPPSGLRRDDFPRVPEPGPCGPTNPLVLGHRNHRRFQ